MATYARRVLPVDQRVADRWGRLNVPDPLPTADGMIAATALVHGLVVATRDVEDFVRSGVTVVNPFEPA